MDVEVRKQAEAVNVEELSKTFTAEFTTQTHPNPSPLSPPSQESIVEVPSHCITSTHCLVYPPFSPPLTRSIINHRKDSLPSQPLQCNICPFQPPSRPPRASYITVQGMGMQQHSYPSHSKHFVFPAAPVSGFTIEEMVDAAAEPGPLRFTRVFVDEVHILMDDSLGDELALVGSGRGGKLRILGMEEEGGRRERRGYILR
jgi:hypothetical protein